MVDRNEWKSEGAMSGECDHCHAEKSLYLVSQWSLIAFDPNRLWLLQTLLVNRNTLCSADPAAKRIWPLQCEYSVWPFQRSHCTDLKAIDEPPIQASSYRNRKWKPPANDFDLVHKLIFSHQSGNAISLNYWLVSDPFIYLLPLTVVVAFTLFLLTSRLLCDVCICLFPLPRTVKAVYWKTAKAKLHVAPVFAKHFFGWT